MSHHLTWQFVLQTCLSLTNLCFWTVVNLVIQSFNIRITLIFCLRKNVHECANQKTCFYTWDMSYNLRKSVWCPVSTQKKGIDEVEIGCIVYFVYLNLSDRLRRIHTQYRLGYFTMDHLHKTVLSFWCNKIVSNGKWHIGWNWAIYRYWKFW